MEKPVFCDVRWKNPCGMPVDKPCENRLFSTTAASPVRGTAVPAHRVLVKTIKFLYFRWCNGCKTACFLRFSISPQGVENRRVEHTRQAAQGLWNVPLRLSAGLSTAVACFRVWVRGGASGGHRPALGSFPFGFAVHKGQEDAAAQGEIHLVSRHPGVGDGRHRFGDRQLEALGIDVLELEDAADGDHQIVHG